MSHAPSIGSASRALGLLEERESKGNDACANKQSNQFVARHEVPHSTKTSGQSSTSRGEHSSDSNSLLKSFLLPKKNYGCGSWNRTNNYRFKAYRVSITPSREIASGK